MKEIIKEAEKFALEEIEKYGLPSKLNFETSNKKGLKLAKEFSVNSDIVQIGGMLADIKLGQAVSENRIKDHVKMSVETTKKFLEQFDLDPETKKKIINCVEGHHKDVPWTCKEAEVVANADCYRFLLVKNWLAFLHSLGQRNTFEETLKYAEQKADEKWNTLSLDICKKELEPQYKLIKEIIQKAK